MNEFEDAEYQGRKVTLNKPFRTSGGSSKFSVYVRNDKGDVVKVNFGSPDMSIKRSSSERRASFRARHDCDNQKDKTTAAYWSCQMWRSDKTVSEMLDVDFTDSIIFDAKTKKAISVRDGVQEYLGAELNLTPADKIFTVYRSPACIANAATKMMGIPLTANHVDLEDEVRDSVGSVLDSMVVDFDEPSYDSKVAVQNTISIKDTLEAMLANGQSELSLGYKAKLVPHTEYDFEQKEIMPHHLAVVQAGRCGSACRFIDKKPKEMGNMSKETNQPVLHKAFSDEQGAMSLEAIAEIVAALPQALSKVPVEKVSEIMPALQEIVGMSKEMGVQMPEMEDEEPKLEDAEKDVEDQDGEMKKPDDEMEDGMYQKEDADFTDSTAFKDAVAVAVDKAVKLHSEVIMKAQNFLDAKYNFSGKDSKQIMRDALATETTETFEDSELALAFKMLKKTPAYKDFGDASICKFDQLKDKEI